MSTQAKQPVRKGFDKRALIRDHPLLGALGPDFAERLAAHATMRTVRRGTTLFLKGDPGMSLFAVCAGSVKIGVPSAAGRDAVFNVVGEGQVFGEIALLDGQPRTADAVAMTDCELMVIDRRDFLPLVQDRPELAVKLIELLCARLRRISEQMEEVFFLNLPGRLAKALLRLCEGKPNHEGKLVITQREIGQMVGMSRESANKQLRAWAKLNWVKLERGGIVVLAPEALALEAAAAADEPEIR
jgi:CRP/FNR family transcriptional regulator, cyclic AMP receptor protein